MITQTPLSITKELLEVINKVNSKSEPIFLNVTPANGAVKQECFGNVESYIKLYGGSIIYGWNVFVWPRVLVDLEFHAVWLSDDGEILDITPRSDEDRVVLFLPDDTLPYNGYMMPSLQFSLGKSPLVRDAIDAASVYNQVISDIHINNPARKTVSRAEFNCVQNKHFSFQSSLESQWKPERNDPCICGSRKKFKQCHGKT
ncbi:MAG: SEC-C domain-containing protein [Methylococcales bacterium]|nr:SEC-C domain-containing protein [Methylococcales bacterium]